MQTAIQNNSEVARLLSQINSEYEAARQGLAGLSQGCSQHEFITKRMERMAELHFQLRGLVGDEAMKQIANELDRPKEIMPMLFERGHVGLVEMMR